MVSHILVHDSRRGAFGAFSAADDAWGAELRRVFGRAACDARYDSRGKGAGGSALRRLHDARMEAMREWDRAKTEAEGAS